MSGQKGSMLEQIPLVDVAQTLDRWWQDSTPKGAVAGRLTPDAIIDRARRAGCGVDIAPIRGWEDRTDEDLLAELLQRTGPLSGELLLVTEASFQPNVGGFRLDASALPNALKEHQERFEPVFNGDVILLILADRRIVCVHHENDLVSVTPPQADAELTDEELERIEQLCRAAAPAPWKSFIEGRDHWGGSDFIQTPGDGIELSGASHADQDFIASARQDVPRLVAEVRRLREALAAMKKDEAPPNRMEEVPSGGCEVRRHRPQGGGRPRRPESE